MEIDEPPIDEVDPDLAEHMREAEKNRIMNQQLLKKDGSEVVNIQQMLSSVDKQYVQDKQMANLNAVAQ